MTLDAEICYRALLTRDARFDGRFFTAVSTTGIFCRPICPAPTPHREHCTFYASAAAAHEAGFRPCLRCSPELAPTLAPLGLGSELVRQALARIAEGELEEQTLAQFAGELGITERHLRRLFVQELGAPPLAVLGTRRLLFAKQLLNETSLPITQVALAAGFRSVRRFNDVIRTTYHASPTELRNRRRATHRTELRGTPADVYQLKLPYCPPFDWEFVLGYLRGRAIPGVEVVTDTSYSRTIALNGHHGIVSVTPAARGNALLADIRFPDVASLGTIVERLRGLFDLEANIAVINTQLWASPAMRELVERRPGIRVPGAWDRFELAVRAILGQQISVAAATTFAGRIAEQYGEPLRIDAAETGMPGLTRVFPTAATLAQADLAGIGLVRARAATLVGFAEAARDNRDLLRDVASLGDCAVRRLTPIRGIGPWTAQYIAMRALRQPDAFPAADLVLKQAMERIEGRQKGTLSATELEQHAEAWRPWRAYAAMHLWASMAPTAKPT